MKKIKYCFSFCDDQKLALCNENIKKKPEDVGYVKYEFSGMLLVANQFKIDMSLIRLVYAD